MNRPALFALKYGMNAFVIRMAPMIFVLTMRMICSSVRPSSGPAKPYPALLKTTSTAVHRDNPFHCLRFALGR